MNRKDFIRGLFCVTMAMTLVFFSGCDLLGPADNNTPKDDAYTIYLDRSAIALEVGETCQLQAVSTDDSKIIWSSADERIATVSDGLVTAVCAGESIIFAQNATDVARCTVTVAEPDLGDAAKDGYRLVWRDEFDGEILDPEKWGYQIGVQDEYGSSNGPMFWGNGELQFYTQDAVSVADGVLNITATRQQMDAGRNYTSGRILTRDKASWLYGYFEARIKVPVCDGMWPAFWMLPQPSTPHHTDNVYGGWPASGEIDIMEAKGRLGNKVDTTLHFGRSWDSHDYVSKQTTLSSNIDEWHTYAIDWTSEEISWYIDGRNVLTVNKSRWWSQDRSNQGESMPFDQPFYILLDLAVGGQYDGYVEPDADFTSASMYIDYVRVYEKIS